VTDINYARPSAPLGTRAMQVQVPVNPRSRLPTSLFRWSSGRIVHWRCELCESQSSGAQVNSARICRPERFFRQASAPWSSSISSGCHSLKEANYADMLLGTNISGRLPPFTSGGLSAENCFPVQQFPGPASGHLQVGFPWERSQRISTMAYSRAHSRIPIG
jgi:hypothetical protein